MQRDHNHDNRCSSKDRPRKLKKRLSIVDHVAGFVKRPLLGIVFAPDESRQHHLLFVSQASGDFEFVLDSIFFLVLGLVILSFRDIASPQLALPLSVNLSVGHEATPGLVRLVYERRLPPVNPKP